MIIQQFDSRVATKNDRPEIERERERQIHSDIDLIYIGLLRNVFGVSFSCAIDVMKRPSFFVLCLKASVPLDECNFAYLYLHKAPVFIVFIRFSELRTSGMF